MKKLLLIVVLFFSLSAFSQDVNTLVKEGENFVNALNDNAALEKYKEAVKLAPNNLIALTNCAELCSTIGNRVANKDSRDKYYEAAVLYAKAAYQLYPQSDAANVAMAIAKGRQALVKSGKEKIAAVKEIKAYAEKAIALNINNYRAWHILGKWHYEVSNLSGLERAAAKVMYGALPKASFAAAITCYEKAKQLNDNFVLNHLELAKAYWKNDDDDKAVQSLKYAIALKNKTEDDTRVKSEAQALLKKWE
jgi:tetratricopeptide (TPR) repeat protein